MENIEYLEIYIEDEKFCQEFVEFPFRNSKENHFILCGKKISFEKKLLLSTLAIVNAYQIREILNIYSEYFFLFTLYYTVLNPLFTLIHIFSNIRKNNHSPKISIPQETIHLSQVQSL